MGEQSKFFLEIKYLVVWRCQSSRDAGMTNSVVVFTVRKICDNSVSTINAGTRRTRTPADAFTPLGFCRLLLLRVTLKGFGFGRARLVFWFAGAAHCRDSRRAAASWAGTGGDFVSTIVVVVDCPRGFAIAAIAEVALGVWTSRGSVVLDT